jgi:hypothetical protein
MNDCIYEESILRRCAVLGIAPPPQLLNNGAFSALPCEGTNSTAQLISRLHFCSGFLSPSCDTSRQQEWFLISGGALKNALIDFGQTSPEVIPTVDLLRAYLTYYADGFGLTPSLRDVFEDYWHEDEIQADLLVSFLLAVENDGSIQIFPGFPSEGRDFADLCFRLSGTLTNPDTPHLDAWEPKAVQQIAKDIVELKKNYELLITFLRLRSNSRTNYFGIDPQLHGSFYSFLMHTSANHCARVPTPPKEMVAAVEGNFEVIAPSDKQGVAYSMWLCRKPNEPLRSWHLSYAPRLTRKPNHLEVVSNPILIDPADLFSPNIDASINTIPGFFND